MATLEEARRQAKDTQVLDGTTPYGVGPRPLPDWGQISFMGWKGLGRRCQGQGEWRRAKGQKKKKEGCVAFFQDAKLWSPQSPLP